MMYLNSSGHTILSLKEQSDQRSAGAVVDPSPDHLVQVVRHLIFSLKEPSDQRSAAVGVDPSERFLYNENLQNPRLDF